MDGQHETCLQTIRRKSGHRYGRIAAIKPSTASGSCLTAFDWDCQTGELGAAFPADVSRGVTGSRLSTSRLALEREPNG